MEKRRAGTRYIGDLPGEGPWRLRAWRGFIVAVSPNHAPLIIDSDGKIERIQPMIAATHEGVREAMRFDINFHRES